MQTELNRIATETVGGGCFICNGDGEVVSSSTTVPLESGAMVRTGHGLAQILGALDGAGHPVSRLDFQFEQWRLLAQRVGNGLLVVLCSPESDVSFLRLSMEVASEGWTRDSGIQKKLKGKSGGAPVGLPEQAPARGRWSTGRWLARSRA